MSCPTGVTFSSPERAAGSASPLVQHFVERGDVVYGCSRSEAGLRHERYTHFQFDITHETDVEALFGELRARGGRLDALINNAGVAGMNAVALTTLDAARRIIDVNLIGTFLCSRAGIRLLRSSPTGRIVNLTTVAVALRLEGEAVYASAKSAVETFTRVLAREVAPFGITCNAVGPSPVRTRLTGSVPEAKIQKLLDRQAIHRWGETADVVNVVDFFLRPESGMVTGQVVYLGGVG